MAEPDHFEELRLAFEATKRVLDEELKVPTIAHAELAHAHPAHSRQHGSHLGLPY